MQRFVSRPGRAVPGDCSRARRSRLRSARQSVAASNVSIFKSTQAYVGKSAVHQNAFDDKYTARDFGGARTEVALIARNAVAARAALAKQKPSNARGAKGKKTLLRYWKLKQAATAELELAVEASAFGRHGHGQAPSRALRRARQQGRRAALRGHPVSHVAVAAGSLDDLWPTLRRMRTVALLGSTGSVGRQAIQVCDDDPELRVCALAAGSDADGVRARGRAPRRAHDRAGRPGRGSAARARFSGRVLEGQAGVAQLARRERGGRRAQRRRRRGRAGRHAGGARGRHRRRARQQGEPRRGRPARARGAGAQRRAAAAGRLRALGAAPAARGRGARGGRGADRDGQRRPLPRALGGRARARSPPSRRCGIRPGRWARASRSTRRRS